MKLATVIVVLLSVACSLAYGQSNHTFRLSNTLGSNMVLQRKPHQAVIWGWSQPQDTVTVYHANWVGPFTADENGMWKAELPSTEEGGPYTISAQSKHFNSEIHMDNVVFGDVYLCGGQSNMQFTVDCGFNATSEVEKADKYEDIRVFTVGQKTSSATALTELATIEQNWTVASRASIGGGNWTYFSAVCWYFGRDLYDRLEKKVPIGLISNNWGGTCVQAWSSPDALAKCNQTAGSQYETFESVDGKEKAGAERAGGNSGLYNAMIHPYLPMRMSGAIWYQGECNVGASPQHGGEYYGCQFPAMIDDWRTKFALLDMYFGFVQLAPWIASKSNSTAVAELRQSQMAALKLQNVGMAIAGDHGDPTSPFGSVHPRDKQDIGFRLSLTALALQYKMPLEVYQGPICTGANVANMQPGTGGMMHVQLTLDFQPSTVGHTELYVKKNVTCPVGVPPASCSSFQLQSRSDQSWHDAPDVVMLGENVAVSGSVPFTAQTKLHPVSGVRYGFSDWPVLMVYNAVGLPAVPFSIELETP
eukprot:scpid15436/ scgid35319/ Sialate O-acetylesterase; Sialic acid-specific 9-O-acetylesterase; Yolk sac protein 2; Sialate O-acetylesterase small subunit; Sialate O-acetylesterase large subunit